MICYRDMTFCTFYEGCGADRCDRALTPEVQEQADRWWGKEGGAPICVFGEKPECYKQKEGADNEE